MLAEIQIIRFGYWDLGDKKMETDSNDTELKIRKIINRNSYAQNCSWNN